MVAALVVDLRMISQLVNATLHSSLFTLWVSNETEARTRLGLGHHWSRAGNCGQSPHDLA